MLRPFLCVYGFNFNIQNLTTNKGAHLWERLIVLPFNRKVSRFYIRIGLHENLSPSILAYLNIAAVPVLFIQPFIGDTDSQRLSGILSLTVFPSHFLQCSLNHRCKIFNESIWGYSSQDPLIFVLCPVVSIKFAIYCAEKLIW